MRGHVKEVSKWINCCCFCMKGRGWAAAQGEEVFSRERGEEVNRVVGEGERRFGLVLTWPKAREDTQPDPLAKNRRCGTILEVC